MMSSSRKTDNRRIVYCLLCQTPQKYISTHLKRSCMAGRSPEECREEYVRAKMSMRAWTIRGRIWDYNQIGRDGLVKELQERGFFILNPPSDADDSALNKDVQQPGASSAEGTGSAEEPGPTGVGQQMTTDRMKKGTRKSMRTMGMYVKFPPNDPLLKRFKKHLRETLQIVDNRQEIHNVSRWLRFLMPEADHVSADFIRSSDKIQDYIKKLEEAGLNGSTVSAYLHNMLRFARFMQIQTDLGPQDASDCGTFISTLKSQLQSLKAQGKAAARSKLLLSKTTSLRDCLRVLSVVQDDMQQVSKDLLESRHVAKDAKTRFRYFCQAVVLLRHAQRPSVVEKLTAREWLRRTAHGGRVIVTHQVQGLQKFSFALSEGDADMLNIYYTKIRANYLQGLGDKDEGTFFLSKSGSRITCVHTEVRRLHQHYKVPSASSQDVRYVLERQAQDELTEEQRALLSSYVDPLKPNDGDDFSSDLSADDVVLAAGLLDTLAGASEELGDQRGQKRQREPSEEEGTDLGAFFEKFPVTLEGKAPSKKLRVEAGFSPNRTLYDKWRLQQYKLREQHLLSKWTSRKPALSKVKRFVTKSNWKANCPPASDVLDRWTAPTREQLEQEPAVSRRSQR